MKKTILLFLLIGKFASAQITLEHTYPTYAGLYHVSPSEWDYAYVSNGTANIYSLNHSFLLSFSLSVPGGVASAYIWSLSKNLFTTDNKYVLGYYYYSSSIYHTSVIDQDGAFIFQMDSILEGSIINTPQGTKMLIGPSSGTKVYSLPGTYYSLASAVKGVKPSSNQLSNAYPDPSVEYVTLPYHLKQGEKGEMIIVNTFGQVIQQYKIDDTFDNILFDISEQPAGTYFYYIVQNGNKSEAKKFIKA